MDLNQALSTYLLFGMVMIRCSGVAVFAPFFGAEHFPARARIGMVFFFALLLYPAATAHIQIPDPLNMWDLAFLTLQELSIGIVIGFLSSIVFMGAQLAGEVMGQQIGFSIANILDPISNQNVSLIGFLNMNLAILIFILANLHLFIIYILKSSYDYVGIGELAYSEEMLGALQEVGGNQINLMFVVALKLAAPILLVMLLNSVVVGFLTRTMPQLNLMVLGIPLRVGIGLTVLVVTLPKVMTILADGAFFDGVNDVTGDGAFQGALSDIQDFVRSLRLGGGN